MSISVHAQEVFPAHFRCIDIAEYVGQPGFDKSILYRRQATGAFRMRRAGVMLQTVGVTDIRSGQSGIPLL